MSILDLSDIKCGKGTCFVFTSWDEEEPQFNENTMWYMCYKREEGGETQGLHYQGYVQMMCQQRIAAVKKELNITKGWVQAQKASQAQTARAYVWKLETGVGDPIEHGTFRESEQGKRTDIDEFVDAAKDIGNNKRKMYVDHPACMVKYPKAYDDIRATFTEPRTWKTKVVVFYGMTGSGKSHTAAQLFPDAYVFGTNNKGWWDGYDAHDVVIIEDFRGSFMSIEDWLQLCDRYKITVNKKGGRAQFVPKLIIITCSAKPSDWWKQETVGERYPEIERRIDELYVFRDRVAYKKLGWRHYPEKYIEPVYHTETPEVCPPGGK